MSTTPHDPTDGLKIPTADPNGPRWQVSGAIYFDTAAGGHGYLCDSRLQAMSKAAYNNSMEAAKDPTRGAFEAHIRSTCYDGAGLFNLSADGCYVNTTMREKYLVWQAAIAHAKGPT